MSFWRTRLFIQVIVISIGLGIIAFSPPSECYTIAALKSNISFHTSMSEGEAFIYYGYVPRETDKATSFLYIVGNHEGTIVRVYTIPELEPIDEFTINKMEYRSIRVNEGSMFKVISNQPITAVIVGGKNIIGGVSSITTFYTSVDGGFVGREFILPTFHDEGGSQVYTIYALEKAEISIFNSTGEIEKIELNVYEFRNIWLPCFQICRIVSTGRIMLQSFSEIAPVGWMTTWKSYGVPALEGGYLGKYFFARGIHPGWQAGGVLPGIKFTLTSTEDARLRVYNLKGKARIKEEGIKSGENKTLYFFEQNIFFQSDKPVILNVFSNGGGLIASGLRGGESAYIYVPSGESFVFSQSDGTVVEVDEAQYLLKSDEYLMLPVGLHKIGSNKPIIIIMTDYGSGPPLSSYGACLPSSKTLEIHYPDLEIPPIERETSWLNYIMIGVAAVLVVSALVILLRRRVSKAAR
ncbi:MAG: hypothetical protein QXY73_05465 [Candidatus Bathyarchaeia archaeon]